jgi:hypothetical protein
MAAFEALHSGGRDQLGGFGIVGKRKGGRWRENAKRVERGKRDRRFDAEKSWSEPIAIARLSAPLRPLHLSGRRLEHQFGERIVSGCARTPAALSWSNEHGEHRIRST